MGKLEGPEPSPKLSLPTLTSLTFPCLKHILIKKTRNIGEMLNFWSLWGATSLTFPFVLNKKRVHWVMRQACIYIYIYIYLPYIIYYIHSMCTLYVHIHHPLPHGAFWKCPRAPERITFGQKATSGAFSVINYRYSPVFPLCPVASCCYVPFGKGLAI